MSFSSAIFGLATNFYGIAIASIIWGIGWAFFGGSYDALIYDTLIDLRKEKLYKQVMGFNNALSYTGGIIALYLGYKLYTINPNWPFYASAVVYLISAIILTAFKEPVHHKKAISFKKDFIKGFEIIKNSIKLKYLLIFPLSVLFFINVVYDLRSVILVNAQLKEKLLVYYFLLTTLISAFVNIVFPKLVDKIGLKKTKITIVIFGAMAYFLISINTTLAVVSGTILIVLIHNLWTTYYNEEINKDIPSKYRATTFSAINFLSSILFILSPVIGAFFYQKYGSLAFLGFAIYSLIAYAIISLMFRRYRDVI